jgi:hypothetical protein
MEARGTSGLGAELAGSLEFAGRIPRIRWVSRRARIWLITLLLCAAAADSVLAAGSRPFTWRADLTTALGLAGVVLVGLTSIRLQRHQPITASDPAGAPPSWPALLAWGLLAAAVTTFELVNYFESPRKTHPTISSLLDALAGHDVLRGLLFAAWLGAGWWLWRSP